MSKKVLITGAAGFIGSNLAKRFLAEGWDVTGVDDMSAGRFEFLPNNITNFVEADFASNFVLDLIKVQNYDVVCHLAARPRVSYSVEHPVETHDVNVTKSVALLDACKGNVGRFVNTSSSSVYGGASKLPTPEHYPHNPKSPYALQKSIIESYCHLYSELYDLDTVTVRPFNVFGPHQLGDNPYSCAVSAWLYAIKHGKPLRSDGDGTQTRDVTYVDNVVDVFYRCATAQRKFNGKAFNAGTGMSVSNNEILEWFKLNFPNCEIVTAPPRAGDVKHTLADVVHSDIFLGYKPIITFWEGLELTKTWALNSPLF